MKYGDVDGQEVVEIRHLAVWEQAAQVALITDASCGTNQECRNRASRIQHQ